MIAYIKGIIEDIGNDFIIIELMGIGIKLIAPFSTIRSLPPIGSTIKLHTHLHVKEEGFQIYGFITVEELYLFEKLLTISGVGPKAALSILSNIPIDKFINAISAGDYKVIEAAPGIGKKTAQRIILELKDKLHGITMNSSSPNVSNDAVEALISLGYTRSEAISALSGISCDNVEDAVRQALKKLMNRV